MLTAQYSLLVHQFLYCVPIDVIHRRAMLRYHLHGYQFCPAFSRSDDSTLSVLHDVRVPVSFRFSPLFYRDLFHVLFSFVLEFD